MAKKVKETETVNSAETITLPQEETETVSEVVAEVSQKEESPPKDDPKGFNLREASEGEFLNHLLLVTKEGGFQKHLNPLIIERIESLR